MHFLHKVWSRSAAALEFPSWAVKFLDSIVTAVVSRNRRPPPVGQTLASGDASHDRVETFQAGASQQTIEHIDIKRHNVVPLVEAMQSLAFSARDLARAADIYDRMLRDKECGVILCLAGSLISAGLKQVFIDMIRNRMVDAIVSTGANIVDQDFFEALGFKHYIADERLKSGMDDGMLRDHAHRPHLRHADRRGRAADLRRDGQEDRRRPAAAALFLARVHPRDGRHLEDGAAKADSIVQAAYQNDVPIFCPAFSDCSAGLGIVAHYHERRGQPKTSFDSAKDFYELTQIKMNNPVTGLFMIGGGVPKNFAQDIVVAADILMARTPASTTIRRCTSTPCR